MGAGSGIVGEYHRLRNEADADLLAMQVGDFYEFFGENAELVHEELDLKLSSKSSGGSEHAMAGVPVNEIEGYVHALVDRGYRVAIADQYETNNGHARRIDRIVTPGTTLHRRGEASGYLIGLAVTDDTIGMALVDVVTGRCYVDRPRSVQELEDLREYLAGLDVTEVIVGPSVPAVDSLRTSLDAVVTCPEHEGFDATGEHVTEQFGSGIIDSLELTEATVKALEGILAYLEVTDQALLASLARLERYRSGNAVALDATTKRNLELTETFRGEREGSLLETIDHTVTAGGGRLLREWLHRPTQDHTELEARLNGIEALLDAPLASETLRDDLEACYDLDSLTTRCAHGSATPHDLGRIRDTLAQVPALRETIAATDSLTESALSDLLEPTEDEIVATIADEIQAALVADPPDGAGDGGIFRTGWDEELDEVIAAHDRLRTWFDELAEREASQYGFERVSVGETRADGYYIQVPEDEHHRVPDQYEPVKTVAAGTRYRTDEIEEREREFYRLQERRVAMERERFEALRDRVGDHVETLHATARALSGLDVRLALARHARRHDWVRPHFRDDGVLEIDQGRHPVVEQTTRFVPNDCRFDAEHEQVLVTGPNMSGKSTYIRQVALLTLLAQIGSFVPADHAAITPVDGIYTRVGALDELAQGRSTFMVEMQELARILHQANEDSLVILDEVGRGTATYDGMSIAWATVEYLHNDVGARTLFATHYHELTELAEQLPGVANRHVAVDDSGEEVVFLRTIEPGPSDRSYGVHVAELAGVPDPVVGRATEVLDRLREDKAIEARDRDRSGTQVVFDLDSGSLDASRSTNAPENDPWEDVLDELETIDIAEMTPLEALAQIEAWQDIIADRNN